MCDYIELCHLNFTTNGRSFFIHLIGESNILLKYSNYMAFSHFHGVTMNNLGLTLSIERLTFKGINAFVKLKSSKSDL